MLQIKSVVASRNLKENYKFKVKVCGEYLELSNRYIKLVYCR